MSKRVPTSQLDHDNWDQEDEKEEPGVFAIANERELKNRVIKKAKRTSLNTSDSSSVPSPFRAFSGFTNKTTQPNFSFLTRNVTPEASASAKGEQKSSQNGCSLSTEVKYLAPKTTESTVAAENSYEKTEMADSVQPSTSSSGVGDPDIQYFKMLRNLNESLLKWVQLHFSKNPCCNFCPVFNDYKNYVNQLEIKYLHKKKTASQSTPSESNSATGTSFKIPGNSQWMRTTQSKSDFFKCESSKESEKSSDDLKDAEMKYGAGFSSNTTNTSTFSFGIKNYPTATSGSKPADTPKTTEKSNEETSTSKDSGSVAKIQPFNFSFGSKSVNDENTAFDKSGVQNSEKKLFTFDYKSSSSSTNHNADSNAADNNDEDYVPPKNEIAPITEDDAVYTKRCKLFFQKEGEYVEKGVGTLYLKPIEDKTQLLIRADTSLGNVLLNIMLNTSLPMQRTGKNNVLIMCIPNPPMEKQNDSDEGVKKAVPILIRVKSSEDADELLNMLNKYKS